MERVSCFGVGCFHFGMKVTVPCRFEMARYSQDVNDALGHLETIEEYSVDSRDRVFEVNKQPSSMTTGGLFPPHIQRVGFVIRIPLRTQIDIMKSVRGSDVPWEGVGTERFKVTTKYYYHGPVTVVECLEVDPSADINPADSVVIVREYMEDKVREWGSALRFETIGPSPFHVQFFVVEDGSVFDCEVDHRRRHGYDQITFRVHPDAIANDVTGFVIGLMGRHLSYYYSLSRIRSRRVREWRSITTLWKRVCGEPSSAAAIGGVRRSLTRRASVEMLVRRIMEFRGDAVFRRQWAISARERISKTGGGPAFLEERIDQAFGDTFIEYPTSEMLQLASFYEGRNAKLLDRVAFFVAAVAGGIVGAIITFLVGIR